MANNVEVLLPLMGEGVNEASVTSWLIAEGDFIEEGAPLVQVSTDKVDTEIPAPCSGYLVKKIASENDTVEVNELIAFLSDDKDAKVEYKKKKSEPVKVEAVHEKSSIPKQKVVSTEALAYNIDGVKSSPVVRKLAAEHDIDLRKVRGTGLNHRITKKDVLSYLEYGSDEVIVEKIIEAPKGSEAVRVATTSKDGKEFLEGVEVSREPMSRIRQLTADHMIDSVRIAPHVTTTYEICMDSVVKFRTENKEQFAKEGIKLTFNNIISYAAIQATKKNMIVNCSVDGYDILHKKSVNLGCAVAIDTGLIVPVLKNSEDMDLKEVSRGLNDLATRGRNKKLTPDEVSGGTFSVTNVGGWGSLTSNPIINQPQVAILGIGAIVKRAVVTDDDEIVIKPMMLASLTFDHRVIDGEGGCKFLLDFKSMIENFEG